MSPLPYSSAGVEAVSVCRFFQRRRQPISEQKLCFWYFPRRYNLPCHQPSFLHLASSRYAWELRRRTATGFIHWSATCQKPWSRRRTAIPFQGSIRFVQTSCRISVPQVSVASSVTTPLKHLKAKKVVPEADPPSTEDVNRLYQFFDQSTKLVVLTGAGISTECGIPDYRSPNGAYSTGFKPTTHQDFVRSLRVRRRYWARSYAGWRRFTATQPGSAHTALASLEKAGHIGFMITQNVDRLHHRAGSNPLELHGTVYSVVCLECGNSLGRHLFQDELKALNPKWAEAIESLDHGISPGSDKSFGMKQRPDGDIEIDEKFWEEDFHVPTCHKCNGVLKPDVVFFGDNVPKERAERAMEVAKDCDAFLMLGTSVMTFSASRLVRAAHEAGAGIAAVNIGVTRADDLLSFKINARLGEILPRVLNTGSLSIPSLKPDTRQH